MNSKNKNIKIDMLTGASFVLVILTTWANVYEYGLQEFITIISNEFILLAVAIYHNGARWSGVRETDEMKYLLLEVDFILREQSGLMKKQSVEIKKLKRTINEQPNNVDSL